MILFLLNSTLCMLLLWGFYRLVLQHEKMFQFNRFYLLGSLLFSFVVPNIALKSNVTTGEVLSNSLPFNYSSEVVVQQAGSWDYTIILWVLYSIVTLCLLYRYGQALWKVIDKQRSGKHLKKEGYSLVLISEKITPQTFFKYIFLNEEAYEQRHIDEAIFHHEKTHARQLHTIDIVVIELLRVIFWFNPVLKLYSESIRANHEYLADEFALSKVDDISTYQQLLFNTIAGQNFNSHFSSGLTYSLTKNRLIMMTKNISKQRFSINIGSALGILFLSFFLFSCSATEQGGAEPKEVKEYMELVLDNYDQEGNPVRLSKKDEARMLTLYNKMDNEQQVVIRGLKMPVPESAPQKSAIPGTPPPPPPFPQGAKYYLDGKEVSVFEANMMLPNYKLYNITHKKTDEDNSLEFHITKKD